MYRATDAVRFSSSASSSVGSMRNLYALRAGIVSAIGARWFLIAQGRTKNKENVLDDVFGEHWKPGHKSSPYIPALKDGGFTATSGNRSHVCSTPQSPDISIRKRTPADRNEGACY